MTKPQYVNYMMNQNSKFVRLHAFKQRGVVLFLALIALVVMSLAAVALIRSVDTNTIIAGNLAFRQAATTSADAGIEAAIANLFVMKNAGLAINAVSDKNHPYNQTCLTATYAPDCTAARPGYHSSADPALNLTAAATWNGLNDVQVGTDASGNAIQYIIQRMCRVPNVAIKDADCLFSTGAEDENGFQVKLPENICIGIGCPAVGQTPQIRVTARVTGPKNTVSYVQAFVY